MKKIGLFAIASASLMMLACTDYEGQLTDAYKDKVEGSLNDMEQQSRDENPSQDVCETDPNSCANPNGNSGSTGCGDLWCGATNVDGRVATEFDAMFGESGYWVEYNDYAEGGTSSILWPADVKENAYGNFFGPLCEVYGGITGTAVTDDSIDSPYVGIGFTFDQVWSTPVDITGWDGVCIQYESTAGFYVQLTADNAMVGNNQFKAAVIPSVGVTSVDIPWDNFRQDRGWGIEANLSEIVTMAVGINLKFTQNTGFTIYSIGRYGTCGG